MATVAARVPLRQAPKSGSPLRWLLMPLLAVLIVLLLVILMHWMIRAPEGNAAEPAPQDSAQLVRLEAPKPQQDRDQAAPSLPQLSPPPPPSAPPSLARPALPAIAVPAIAISVPQVDVANVGTGVANLGSGLGLGSGFGGFAGGGGGNGNGGSGGGGGQGFARGEGFKGRELIPLSTARPQMPDWACKQKLQGWVEVVFVVNTRGHVENVRIVDAQPRGVYEAAAIESVGNWIYAPGKQAAEVKQRVEMNPEDCVFNYGQ
ncbi:MAG: hypothetical protein NVS9B10_21560 [Nevskia sp.]